MWVNGHQMIVHNKWSSSYKVKSYQTLKLNLVWTSEKLQTCKENHENKKQFAKAVLTTPVNISYNNVELKFLAIERYSEPTE